MWAAISTPIPRREVTAYYARVLQDDVPLALDVVADILRNPVFDPQKEIEIERGVILQEIGQALDTPDDIIFDWLQEKAYPRSPAGPHHSGPRGTGESFFAQTTCRISSVNIIAPAR